MEVWRWPLSPGATVTTKQGGKSPALWESFRSHSSSSSSLTTDWALLLVVSRGRVELQQSAVSARRCQVNTGGRRGRPPWQRGTMITKGKALVIPLRWACEEGKKRVFVWRASFMPHMGCQKKTNRFSHLRKSANSKITYSMFTFAKKKGITVTLL